MKRLALVVIAAGLLWSGWWFIAAQNLRGEVEGWFDARRADGWDARYDNLAILGFPNRLDLTLSGLTLSDPASGVTWEAPFFQILQLVYSSGHEILVWPDSQTVTTASDRYQISSEGLRASLVHESDGTVQRANLEAAVLNIATQEGGAALAGVTLGLQAVPSVPRTYRIGLNADSIAGPEAQLVPRPDSLDALRLQAEVVFDEVWRLSALETGRPQPRKIDLRLAEYQVDGVELKMAGRLDVDDAGRADGEVTLRIVDWRDLMAQLRDAEQIPGSVLDTLEQGIGVVTQLTGDKETLDLSLTLNNGQMALGLIPLGPAPRLSLP